MFSTVATFPTPFLLLEELTLPLAVLEEDDHESCEVSLDWVVLDCEYRSGPSEKVGATALTLTLSLDHSLESPAVILSKPALLAARAVMYSKFLD